MTVIEEEKYQVNKGIKLAEEAQQSLDNIVGYTNNIDQLVYSISYGTLS